MRILRFNIWHPFKLQMLHCFAEDDVDSRVDFCELALNMYERVPGFVSFIIFADEAYFYIIGEVNKQNVRYWMIAFPIACRIVKFNVRRNAWCGAGFEVTGFWILFP